MILSTHARGVFEPKLPEEKWEVRPKVVQGQGLGSRTKAVQRRVVGRVAILVMIFLVFGLFYVWSRVQVVQIRYDLGEIQKRNAQLQEQVQRLETEVVRLKSPQRLEVFAKEGLGMVLPNSAQTVIIKEKENEPKH